MREGDMPDTGRGQERAGGRSGRDMSLAAPVCVSWQQTG